MTRILAGLLAVCLAAPAAVAQDRLQPDFTFKRVGLPKPGERRLTIQIDPTAPPATLPPITAPTPPAVSGGTGPLDWFWTAVPPELAASGPGRLQAALSAMRTAPQGQGVAAPRLTTLNEIARRHGPDILRATVGTRVSPALVLALISVESGGRADAVSHAGARGLMQLMPATADRFAVADSFAPSENIRGGVAYLDWLLGHFDGDPILALAGYNAGEGSVRNAGGVPPFAETRAYVPKVLAAFDVARALCLTPPELVSDGCVFAVNTRG